MAKSRFFPFDGLRVRMTNPWQAKVKREGPMEVSWISNSMKSNCT
jgi:hypothetical protein